MLKRKILALTLGALCSTQIFAGESLYHKTNRLEKEVQELKKVIHGHKKGWFNFVTSSPFIGLRSEFDGSDTITNLPSINEDMRLLQQKQFFHGTFKKNHLPISSNPLIILSGKLEALTYGKKPYHGKFNSGVNLSTAELDAVIYAHNWVTGFMAFNYDDAPDFVNRNFANNSRIFLNKGFITIGNLSKSPYYLSMGQMYIPFGAYSSGMISSPLTAWLGKTRARAINVGYRGKNGIFAQAYGFNNVMKTNDYDRGMNLGFEGLLKDGAKFSMAAGYMSDLANSNGMQSNGNVIYSIDANGNPVVSTFGGFGKHSLTGVTKLDHTVPGLNVHAKYSKGNWNLLAEYVTALRHFDINDMQMNNRPAKPSAFHAEAIYGFKMLKGKPSHLAVGYETSKDAMALVVPSKRYTATLSTSLWRNTIQAVEFRHDKMYSRGNTAAGRIGTLPNGVATTATADPNLNAGQSENMVALAAGLYF